MRVAKVIGLLAASMALMSLVTAYSSTSVVSSGRVAVVAPDRALLAAEAHTVDIYEGQQLFSEKALTVTNRLAGDARVEVTVADDPNDPSDGDGDPDNVWTGPDKTEIVPAGASKIIYFGYTGKAAPPGDHRVTYRVKAEAGGVRVVLFTKGMVKVLEAPKPAPLSDPTSAPLSDPADRSGPWGASAPLPSGGQKGEAAPSRPIGPLISGGTSAVTNPSPGSASTNTQGSGTPSSQPIGGGPAPHPGQPQSKGAPAPGKPADNGSADTTTRVVSGGSPR